MADAGPQVAPGGDGQSGGGHRGTGEFGVAGADLAVGLVLIAEEKPFLVGVVRKSQDVAAGEEAASGIRRRPRCDVEVESSTEDAVGALAKCLIVVPGGHQALKRSQDQLRLPTPLDEGSAHRAALRMVRAWKAVTTSSP